MPSIGQPKNWVYTGARNDDQPGSFEIIHTVPVVMT
jgi:hypothetical protein